MTREEIEERIMPLLIVVRVGGFGAYEMAIDGVVAIHNEAIEAAAKCHDRREHACREALETAGDIRALKVKP